MNPSILVAFATFMADFLVNNKLVPPPQSEDEAKMLITLVLKKFDQFLVVMRQAGAIMPAAPPGDIN
jgi:hypothetical protein